MQRAAGSIGSGGRSDHPPACAMQPHTDKRRSCRSGRLDAAELCCSSTTRPLKEMIDRNVDKLCALRVRPDAGHRYARRPCTYVSHVRGQLPVTSRQLGDNLQVTLVTSLAENEAEEIPKMRDTRYHIFQNTRPVKLAKPRSPQSSQSEHLLCIRRLSRMFDQRGHTSRIQHIQGRPLNQLLHVQRT